MPTAKKADTIDALAERLKAAKSVVLTDYRSLPTPELNTLRSRLKGASSEYQIVKNTLLSIAAQRIGVTGLDPLLEGPTAMAFSFEKDIEVAKALTDYVRTSRTTLTVKGGILDGTALSAADVQQLAGLAPKRSLQAQLAGNIQGPLAGFVGLLDGALGEFVRVLAEREKQLGPAES